MSIGAVVTRAPGQKATELLSAWRAAERRRERLAPYAEGYREAGIDTVNAWLAYQLEVAAPDPEEVAVVVDDERRFVAVSGNVVALMGYETSELLGRRVDDLAAPELVDATPERWDEFIRAGRDAQVFSLVAKDGSVVAVTYVAQVDFPIPGFHLSRLRPADGGRHGVTAATARSASIPSNRSATTEGLEGLATRWLAAEGRAAERPEAATRIADATRLGEAYDLALRAASQEELMLAWESARRAQAACEIGSMEWAEARRVSELLRTEYAARVRVGLG